MATKLAGEDKLTEIREIGTEIDGTRDVVLQTVDGMFLKFQLEEIQSSRRTAEVCRASGLKKMLEHVYLPDMDGTAVYKGKEVALGRLKAAKRDGKKERKSGYNRIGSYDPFNLNLNENRDPDRSCPGKRKPI